MHCTTHCVSIIKPLVVHRFEKSNELHLSIIFHHMNHACLTLHKNNHNHTAHIHKSSTPNKTSLSISSNTRTRTARTVCTLKTEPPSRPWSWPWCWRARRPYRGSSAMRCPSLASATSLRSGRSWYRRWWTSLRQVMTHFIDNRFYKCLPPKIVHIILNNDCFEKIIQSQDEAGIKKKKLCTNQIENLLLFFKSVKNVYCAWIYATYFIQSNSPQPFQEITKANFLLLLKH